MRRQIPQHVIRADIAAVLHGQELIGFDPKNSHAAAQAEKNSVPRPPFCPDKVDKGDHGGGVKYDESAGRIGDPRERSNLDADQRGEAEHIEGNLCDKAAR